MMLGGGGSMLRSVRGGVGRASVSCGGGGGGEPFSPATTRPSSPTSMAPHSYCVSEDLLSVPSSHELHTAFSALRRVFGPISHSHPPKDDEPPDKDVSGEMLKRVGSEHHVSSFGSDGDWLEPSLELQLGNPRMSKAHGVERVYDAFHLLETDPSIQKMVLSVSSDRAVWDAILNNEAVQHLRKSFSEAEEDDIPLNLEENSDDEPTCDPTNLVQWIFNNTKTKILEVIERMTELVKHLLQIGNNGEKIASTRGVDGFEEKLRTSFFISIVVLLVVAVSRTYKASQ